jgi:5-methylcytosine-specific restriction protein A
MTPIRICLEPGCPDVATKRGRCDRHRRDLERERSRRRRETTGGIFKTKLWLRRREQVLFEQPLCPGINGNPCDRIAEEVDHITPLSQGGAPYRRDNLRGLCSPCHQERHRV